MKLHRCDRCLKTCYPKPPLVYPKPCTETPGCPGELQVEQGAYN